MIPKENDDFLKMIDNEGRGVYINSGKDFFVWVNGVA
jgi:hypothetical protein